MTVIETIFERAKEYPDRPAIITTDDVVTPYRDLAPALPGNFPYGLVTSGTTGVPKKIDIPDEHVVRRLERLGRVRGPGFAKLTSIFAPFSFQSAVGAHLAAYMFQKGGTVMIAGGTFDPQRWLDACAKHRIEGLCFFPKLPLFWSLLFGHEHRFAHVCVHGSSASLEQLGRIQAALGGDVWINYGVSEIGHVAGGAMEEVADIPGCVGHVDADVAVEIEGGQVRMRSDTMAPGYSDDAELTAQKFKDGWFYPGDLGRFEKGMLVIDGRV